MDFIPEEYKYNRESPYGFHIEKPMIKYGPYKRMEDLNQYIRNLPKEDKEELMRLCRIFKV